MPNSPKVERKLAAIMFTDIVGYTEQMSKDQDAAFFLLEEKQSKLKPLIKENNGKLIKEMGDGTLSYYPTAIDASKCSVELQKLIKDNDKLNVRVGIHLGDTTFKDGDVFGDGVNIASRLEGMSPSGGVLVSKNVYDELLSREGFEGVSLGLQSLKGVGRLVEVYALKDKYLTIPDPDDYKENKVEGEIYISVPQVEKNAKKYHQSFDKELARIIIHGSLHLLDYKDELPDEKIQMTKKEDHYLNILTWENIA